MAGALDRYKEAVLWDFIRFEIPEAWDCFYVADLPRRLEESKR